MRNVIPGGRVGRAVVVLAVVWAAGLAHSARLTLGPTGSGDPFADVEAYPSLHEILGDAVLAVFHTDDGSPDAIRRERWSPQYGAMPTVLVAPLSDDRALAVSRAGALREGAFHLVYEYRRPASRVAFGERVQALAASIPCALTTHSVAPGTLVYELSACDAGSRAPAERGPGSAAPGSRP